MQRERGRETAVHAGRRSKTGGDGGGARAGTRVQQLAAPPWASRQGNRLHATAMWEHGWP
jgi:hypothetical protein